MVVTLDQEVHFSKKGETNIIANLYMPARELIVEQMMFKLQCFLYFIIFFMCSTKSL